MCSVRYLHLIIIVLILGCGSNKVDELFGNLGPGIPVPESLSLTITTPAADGKRVGWSTTFAGSCTQPGASVKITAASTISYGVCSSSNTWSTSVDFSSAAVGNVTATAVLVGSAGQLSSSKTRVVNKIHTNCDSPAVRALTFAAGTGVPLDPYFICTESQFNNVRTLLASNYTLMNDLNMEDSVMSPIPGNFTGIFDGNNFEISNYTFYAPTTNQIALFQRVLGGTIQNLSVTNVNLWGNAYVGAIVAYSSGPTINCTSSGTVRGTQQVGGLVGRTDPGGTVSNSSSSADAIASTNFVGGLVGYTQDAITGSSATGSVTGLDYVGGLLGYGNNVATATIANSYATGTVTGEDFVGGLVGSIVFVGANIITNSYATGNVVGTQSYIGGLVGNLSGDVDASYATGNVSVAGSSLNNFAYAGGLVGAVRNISNSYAAGVVSVTNPGFGYSNIGGLAGRVVSTSTNSYATGNVSVSSAAYISVIGGFAGYVGSTTDGSYSTGSLTIANDDNGDYAGGLIGQSLGAITNSYSTSNISITSAIGFRYNTVGGLVGYAQLGNITGSYATGSLTLSQGIASSSYGGLVGYMVNDIINSYATGNITITNTGGLSSYAGGLVGQSASSISGSYATGSVSSSGHYLGGLVGQHIGGAGRSILNSYATGNATSLFGERVGGLIGSASGIVTVQNSYATGNASAATNYAGGLIGVVSPGGVIDTTYATGSAYAGTGSAGGLIGYFSSNATASSITTSYAFGNVSSGGPAGSYLGGLVGRSNSNTSTITASMAAGTVVSDAQFVGGLIGDSYSQITNCYAVGQAGGSRYVGGLVGYQRTGTTIDTSYAIGNILRTSGALTVNFGGLIGSKDAAGVINNSYRNSDATFIDQPTSTPFVPNVLGTGLTSAQMTVQVNFVGFTFGALATEWKMPAIGYIAPWNLMSYSYPILGFQ